MAGIRQALNKTFDNAYINASGTAEQIAQRQDAMLECILALNNNTYDGLSYGKWQCTRVSPTTTEQDNGYNNAIIFDKEEEATGYTYMLVVQKEAVPEYTYKLLLDAVANMHTKFSNYGQIRLYTASNAYSTLSQAAFFSLFDDWLIFDYNASNSNIGTENYGLINPFSNNAIVTPDHVIGLFFNGSTHLNIPFGYTNHSQAAYKSPYALSGRYMSGISKSGVGSPLVEASTVPILEIYAALKQGIDTTSNNRYTLRGNMIYYCTNSSGGSSFFIMKKELLDEFITDFYKDFGITLTYTGNIPAPTPGPSGDAVDTEPGQPDNSTDNTGGKGELIGDIIEYPQAPFGATGMGTITYLLDVVQFLHVLHSFNDPNIFTTLTDLDMNNVISVNLWPMALSSSGIDEAAVVIGNTPISLESLGSGHTYAKEVKPTDIYTYNFGTISIPKDQYFGGFLDFEPYTTIRIYLPYCGLQTINAHDVIGHSIQLICTYDLYTGTGQYLLLVDYKDKNGNTSYAVKYKWPCMVAQPIKITGSSFATLQQAFTQNAGQFIKGYAGDPASLIKGTIGVLHETMSGQQSQASSQGDSLDRYGPQKPYLIITQPETIVPNNYNIYFGRPCLQEFLLNDLVGKGFTTVPQPLLDINATEYEKNYIINALKEGVYL